jgi:hypothetical protein
MNAAFLEDTAPEEYRRKGIRRTVDRWTPKNGGGWIMMLLAALMTLQLVVRGAAHLNPAEAQPSYQFEQVSYSAELTRDHQCPAR